MPGGEGLLGGLVGKLGKEGGSGFKDAFGLGGGHTVGGMVEVRFEWKRGKSSSKRKEGGRRKDRSSVMLKSNAGGRPNGGSQDNSVSGSNAPSTTSLPGTRGRKTEGGSPPPPPGSADKRSKRLSTISISQQSTSTSITSEAGGDRERGAEQDVDEGEESDPEDSETPWNCTLKIRRFKPPASAPVPPADSKASYASDSLKRRGQEKDKTFDLRLKVALLSPTPHHPKVVALLKIPFPLPDVEIEKAELRPRALGAGSHRGAPNGNAAGAGSDVLLLTAEEIKDVVASTGLWLVVREGFGGVGKVSRKGDGWRIRG
jgi:hypothetical protein